MKNYKSKITKWLRLAAILHFAFCIFNCSAQVPRIWFTNQLWTGSSVDTTINIRAANPRTIFNGVFSIGLLKGTNITTTNGVGVIQLLPNRYTVAFAGIPSSFDITVTNTSQGDFNAADLTTNVVHYDGVQSIVGTGGITATPPAGAGGSWTIDGSGVSGGGNGGSGNVLGPPSSTDGTFALYKGNSGKQLTNGFGGQAYGPSSFDAAGAAATRMSTNGGLSFNQTANALTSSNNFLFATGDGKQTAIVSNSYTGSPIFGQLDFFLRDESTVPASMHQTMHLDNGSVQIRGNLISFGGPFSLTGWTIDGGQNTFQNMSASALTTGTVSPGLLGSGTSITTKFLRGDSTWQSIVGGGDMLAANNLSDVASAASARANIGAAAAATTLTISGTANQIISSAGAQDLSANRTVTLSLPNAVTTPGSLAVTTDLSAGHSLTVTHGNYVDYYNANGFYLRTNNAPPFDWEFHNTNGVVTYGTNTVTKVIIAANGDLTLPTSGGGSFTAQTGNFSQALTAGTLFQVSGSGNVTSGGSFSNAGPASFAAPSTNFATLYARSGVELPATSPADTNAAVSYSNAVAAVFANTFDPGFIAGSVTNLFGLGIDSNLVQVTWDPGSFAVVPTGAHTAQLKYIGLGGNPLPPTNYFNINTNAILVDCSQVQSFQLCLETNNAAVIFTNVWYLTNYHDRSFTMYVWEDTNGTWDVSNWLVDKGLNVKTNSLVSLGHGTNASEYDTLYLKLDGTSTNLIGTWYNNALAAMSFTNSLKTAGGGGGPVIPSGATWYLGLNEGTGTTTADATGNGHTGTLSGGTLPSWSTPYLGAASLSFSTPAYVNINADAAANPGTGDFSEGCWIKTTSSGTQVVIGKDDGSSAMYLYTGSGNINVKINGSTWGGTYAVNDGNWHLIGFSASGGVVTVYGDGVARGSTFSYTGSVGPTGNIHLGDSGSNDSFKFTGNIDDAWEVVGRALSSSDWSAIYSQAHP